MQNQLQINFHQTTFTFGFTTFTFQILPLILKRSFNTAHSNSATRQNFIVMIGSSIFNVVGYGECGLPPKKPYCYLADISDCFDLMRLLKIALQSQALHNQDVKLYENFQSLKQKILAYENIVFEQIDKKYFKLLRVSIQKIKVNSEGQEEVKYLYELFQILFSLKKICQTNKCFLAAKSAIQFALLDQFAKKQHVKMSQLIHQDQQNFNLLKQHKKCYSFYTLSHESRQQMIENAKYGLKFTKFIKIKFDNNIDSLIMLLEELLKQMIGQTWIIDANASWTPENYKYFQNKLLGNPNHHKFLKAIFCIQQPFSVILSQQQRKEWIKIKNETTLKIIADESFTNVQDIQKMKDLAHGVNIKMEKCGGPIEAIRIVSKLQQNKIQFMFGSMVSSHLGCTQVYQFRQFSQYFDIDGALLVASPIVKGGFQWNSQIGLQEIQGQGLCLNNLQELFK